MLSILFSYLAWLQNPKAYKNQPFISQQINAEHSFRTLGADYYIDIAVEHVANARLVLFNTALAQALNLVLPESAKELEQLILKNFAWFKSAEQQNPAAIKSENPQIFFASRYQDADDKTPGNALGDGRALWAGEIIRTSECGDFQYLDLVLKGTGVTPLAWFNHARESHKDGLVSMTEAVHEYIYSLAAQASGINTVGVLAVIELPFYRTVANEKAALVVRVGNHLRFAHYRYFSDNKLQLTKIFEYGLKRDMGLALDYVVKPEDAKKYLDFIVHNLATDAAIYFDVHAIHGSPTFGNRTSCGGTIDLSTFVFADGHHSDYRYMDGGKNSLGGDWSQTEQFFNLFSLLIESLKNSGFKYAAQIMPVEYFLRQFRNTFEQVLTHRWLTRLGLSNSEIHHVSAQTRERFYSIVKSLYEAKGAKKVRFNQGKLFLAAFEPRKILAGTAACIENFDDLPKIWKKLFKVQRHWATYQFADAKPYIKAYQKTLLAIVSELNATSETIAVWMENSKQIKVATRNEPGADFFYDSEKYLVSEKVLQQIRAETINWPKISQTAQDMASGLADSGLILVASCLSVQQ